MPCVQRGAIRQPHRQHCWRFAPDRSNGRGRSGGHDARMAAVANAAVGAEDCRAPATKRPSKGALDISSSPLVRRRACDRSDLRGHAMPSRAHPAADRHHHWARVAMQCDLACRSIPRPARRDGTKTPRGAPIVGRNRKPRSHPLGGAPNPVSRSPRNRTRLARKHEEFLRPIPQSRLRMACAGRGCYKPSF